MKKSSNFQRPRVALLIESSRAFGRATLLGVARYVREHGPWSISFQEHSLCDDIPEWFEHWDGQGIIARMESGAVDRFVKRMVVPTVSLRQVPSAPEMPCVLIDHSAATRLAFEHFQERGFHHFAFCGFDGADYSDARRDGFLEHVTAAGFRCHVFGGTPLPGNLNTVKYEEEGLKDGERVARWIKELPKPIGLMACNDMRGQQVLNACRGVGVAVPDEVAVIGVDNDEVLCDLSDPPLSSVVPNAERIGYEAAAMLDGLMAGKKACGQQVYVKPEEIVTRRSTEVLAIEDRQIAAAERFIREHACEGIDVSDVLRAVPLSRSTLERRYAAILGYSPKHEILRVRLNRAKQLLAETDFPIATIAEKIGLEHTEYLSVIFKKKVGVTPARFRYRVRGADAADRLPAKTSAQTLTPAPAHENG